MMNERPHKKLELWEKAMNFVINIYRITSPFPKEEEFGLKSQLRRAAVSIPSNIAEGLTRKTKTDKLRFLNICNGSLSEIDAQLEIAFRLHYIENNSYLILLNELILIEKLLSGLIRSILNNKV